MLKILLKIWPALTVIALYLIFVYFAKKRRKKRIIEGEFKIIDEKIKKQEEFFSLDNKKYVIILYLSLILTILSLFYAVFSQKLYKTQPSNLEIIENVKIK